MNLNSPLRSLRNRSRRTQRSSAIAHKENHAETKQTNKKMTPNKFIDAPPATSACALQNPADDDNEPPQRNNDNKTSHQKRAHMGKK